MSVLCRRKADMPVSCPKRAEGMLNGFCSSRHGRPSHPPTHARTATDPLMLVWISSDALAAIADLTFVHRDPEASIPAT